MLPITYQQLGDLRVLSNPAVGRQESHESGDCLAMDGQEQETTGKRKTKNSTSLAEGEKALAKAKKESESQAKKEENLRKLEEKALQHALLVSRYEAKSDGTLAVVEQEALRKEEVAHLLSVQTSTSTEPSQLLLLGTVASSSTCAGASTSLVARISQGKEECDPTDQVLDRDDFSPSLHSISQIQILNQARIKNANLLIPYRFYPNLMASFLSPLLTKSQT